MYGEDGGERGEDVHRRSFFYSCLCFVYTRVLFIFMFVFVFIYKLI